MGKTSCKKGQYYCNTDQKCKPIPDGYSVRPDGILVKEDKHGDHEPEMIRSQLKTASRASKRIEKHSRKKENFKAWVQSKITKASDYLDTAADYLDSKDDVKEGSLHKWFKGSKSKDGKGGWVNVVTGGTCASDEPGEGTPKCVSSAKRASMSKKERLSAARRKKKADPNQQQKRGAAAPTYVKTDKPKSKKKKKKMKEEFISLPLQLEVPQSDGEFKLGLMFRESLEQDRGMLFIFENTDHHSFHMKNTFIPLDIAFINEEGVIESIKELDPMNSIPVYPDGKIRYAIEVNRGWFAENDIKVGDIILEDTEETEIDLTEVKDKKGKGSGTKDACYHKVKSRYSVWPSAYASGALVKCRKVGAANWGNSSKKEEVEYEYEVPTKAHYNWRETLDEKCWKGYEKKGMKTMFGKRYPNCVKKTKKEELEVEASSLEEKLVHGNFGNFIKGQKLDKKKEKKYTKPPYEDLAASVDLEGDVVSEKKMTKKQMKKRDEIADAISKKDMKDRYGDEDVRYAIGTKLAMKESKLKALKYIGAGLTGLGIGTLIDRKMKKVFGDPSKKLDKGSERFLKTGEFQEENIQEILDKKDVPHVKKLVGKLRSGSKTHAKQADDLEKAMKEDTAIESELVIQDWNVDDIKFTEIETVDIIKAKPLKESMSNWREDLGEDWQKVNRKDKTDGMSKAAVKAYRKENPGSKLKTAVTKDPKKLKKGSKSAKRRLAFCRRMKGMKKKLTSAKTSRDPDSRINKALRRWNC